MHTTQANRALIPQFLHMQLDEEHRYQSPRRVAMSQTPPHMLTPKQIKLLKASPTSTSFTGQKTNKSTIFSGSPQITSYDNALTKSVQFVQPMRNQIPVVKETIVVQNKAQDEQNQKIISNLLNELDMYKNKCTHLEIHLQTITSELENLKLTQAKIDQILLDNDKINDALEEKIKEANLWKQKYEIEVSSNQQAYYYKDDGILQQSLHQKQEDIEQLNIQIFNLQQENQQLYQTIQTKDEIITTLSSNFNDVKRIEDEVVKKSKIIWKKKENEFVDEINEYSIQIKNAVEEREKWKFKYLEAEKQRGEYRIQYESIKQEVQLLKQENERFSAALKLKQLDFEKLQNNLFTLQQQYEQKRSLLKEYEYKYGNYDQQNRDNDELRSKNAKLQNEAEQLKNSIYKAEDSLKDYSQVQQEYTKLQQKANFQEQQLAEKNDLITSLNEKIECYKIVEQEKDQLSQQVNSLESEFQKYQEQIQALEQELESSKSANKQLSDKLSELANVSQENINLKETLNSNLSQIEELQNKILKVQLEMEVEKSEKKNFKNQIIHLNDRISQKDKIIDEQGKLNEKIDQEIQRNEKMVVEVINYNKLLDQKSREYEQVKLENQSLKEQVLYKNEQIQQLRGDQLVFQKEIERQSNSLAMKNNQIEILHLQLQELDTKSQELQCDRYDRNDQIQLFSQEIDRLNGSLSKRMKEIELLRQKKIFSKELDCIDFKISSSRSNIYNEGETSSPTLLRANEMQFKEIQNDTLIYNLKSQNETLQKQYEFVEKEIERKDSLIAHKQKEYEQLKQKMMEMNKKIENMYILEDQNKVLEIEICQLKKERESLISEINSIKYQYTEFSHLTFKVQDLQYQLVLSRILLEAQAYEMKTLRK